MKHKEPETLTEQLYMAQDIILQTRDNLIRGIIDFLKPEPMTVQDLRIEAAWTLGLGSVFGIIGLLALFLWSLVIIMHQINFPADPFSHTETMALIFFGTLAGYLLLAFTLMIVLGITAIVGAIWRRHQERKAKFPEAK